jgi:hypothetical protein
MLECPFGAKIEPIFYFLAPHASTAPEGHNVNNRQWSVAELPDSASPTCALKGRDYKRRGYAAAARNRGLELRPLGARGGRCYSAGSSMASGSAPPRGSRCAVRFLSEHQRRVATAVTARPLPR